MLNVSLNKFESVTKQSWNYIAIYDNSSCLETAVFSNMLSMRWILKKKQQEVV